MERSTMLNDMRAEVEKNFKELDDLKVENTKLVEKNNSLMVDFTILLSYIYK